MTDSGARDFVMFAGGALAAFWIWVGVSWWVVMLVCLSGMVYGAWVSARYDNTPD